ncbi:MAG: hypothetical protein M3Y60_08790, partial [Bacteroidota bacterium]|nr:hypothetical protein [Bacteroidota bacterium]
YNPTAWTVISDLTQVNDATNRIFFNGVGYIDGEFTAGVPAAFGPVRIFYTIRSGNWTDTNPATTPWSNVSHVGAAASVYPVVGDHVYIGDGGLHNHTVTIISNAQASGGLEISAGSVLDVGTSTGHNFGTFESSSITGSGLLRISSSTATAEFPAGDFGNFIRAGGGTVEYCTTGTQDFTIPNLSAVPTNLPLESYRHLILTPGSGRFIRLPDEEVIVYGNMTVQGSSATGVVRFNSASARTLSIEGNLTVSSGTLQFQNNIAQSLSVAGATAVGASGIFDVANTGTVVQNTVTLAGSLTNNGVVDMAVNSRHADVTFTGGGNHSVTGSGGTTDFNVLTVSKGTSPASVLNVNPSAFSLSGSGTPLILLNGTFRLSSPQSVSIADGVDFNVPATTRLSVDGGTLNITGGNGIELLLAGTLEVLNGSINVGTSTNDNAIVYAATGEPTITVSGGTLNVHGQVRRSFASSQGALIYNQSGSSTVSVALSGALTTTRGVFEILNSGSSFAMSGGVLRINRSSGSAAIADLYLQPSSSSVTGGTIEVGSVATSQTIDINSIIPLYNVSIRGTSNTGRLEANGLTMRGTLDIAATNVFNASGFNVAIAGNLINLNTNNSTGTSVGGYRPGSATQTTTFNGTNMNQFITGVSGNLTNFANLTINNTLAAGIVQLQPDTELRVNGTLTLTNGTLAVATNTVAAIGTVINSARHTSTTGRLLLNGSS